MKGEKAFFKRDIHNSVINDDQPVSWLQGPGLRPAGQISFGWKRAHLNLKSSGSKDEATTWPEAY